MVKSNNNISVIVPNFNYAQYLMERLESIEAQHYPIAELIVLDDASTDKSMEIIHQFQLQTSLNMKIIKNKENSGSVFAQWVKGISEAEGNYIWIAEADDLSDPEFLEQTMSAFQDEEVVLSYCLSRIINADSETIKSDYLEATDDIDKEKWKSPYTRGGTEEICDTFAIKNTIPNVSSVVFRKIDISPIEETLTTFHVAGDWYFYVWLLQHGKIAYTAEILNFYRWHDESVVRRSSHNIMHHDEIIRMQSQIRRDFPVSSEVWKKALSHRNNALRWLHLYNKRIEGYCFIISYEMSGSEQLSAALNRLDGVEVLGENMGILGNIYETWQHAQDTLNCHDKGKGPEDPWYGVDRIDPYYLGADLCKVFVQEVLKPKDTIRISGFREVRFLNKSESWLYGYLEFLLKYFPNAKMIFHQRDLDEVMKLGWIAKEEPSVIRPQLEQLNNWMKEAHLHFRQNTIMSHYDSSDKEKENIKKFITSSLRER